MSIHFWGYVHSSGMPRCSFISFSKRGWLLSMWKTFFWCWVRCTGVSCLFITQDLLWAVTILPQGQHSVRNALDAREGSIWRASHHRGNQQNLLSVKSVISKRIKGNAKCEPEHFPAGGFFAFIQPWFVLSDCSSNEALMRLSLKVMLCFLLMHWM